MMISVEGLDLSGKTVVAREVSKLMGLPYLKITKGSLMEYGHTLSEEQVTKIIIHEIDLSLTSRDVVLDRSYLSAIVAAKIRQPDVKLDDVWGAIPKRLIPDLAIIVTVAHDNAIERSRGRKLTAQDRLTLTQDYDVLQDWMLRHASGNFLKLRNDYNDLDSLKTDLNSLLKRY